MVSPPEQDSASPEAEAAAASDALAEQALASLVGQFARPLDCLRELVQNAIDAGSPRVEVWVRPAPGALEIHVDDFGEGMDEATIDDKLTDLFASDKEDDLTRIGKFGVGFTSIFALDPQAVLVRTGRHGEAWELLFHRDRSYDKTRLDGAVDGTRITLFVPVSEGGAPRLIQECRWVLGSWCEHSDTPITFESRSAAEAAGAGAAADPFAAFDAPAEARETVNRPLALDGDLVVTWEEPGMRALIGLARSPRYGFYNGGLTLVNTADADVLGRWAPSLERYRFKVKSDVLEHTLTRDNVIHDDAWEGVMGSLEQAAESLVTSLVAAAEEAAADGSSLAVWHRHLTAEAPRLRGLRWRRRFDGALVFRGADGAPISYRAIVRAERRTGVVWTHPGEDLLGGALIARGQLLVEALSETGALLLALAGTGHRRRLRHASEDFVMIQAADRPALDLNERALLDGCEALLAASGWRRPLVAGALAGGGWDWRERLTLEAGADGIGRRGTSGGPVRSLRQRITRQALFLNREHPVYRSWLTAAVRAPARAGFGLAQAILHEQGASERAWRRLMRAVPDHLSGGPR